MKFIKVITNYNILDEYLRKLKQYYNRKNIYYFNIVFLCGPNHGKSGTIETLTSVESFSFNSYSAKDNKLNIETIEYNPYILINENNEKYLFYAPPLNNEEEILDAANNLILDIDVITEYLNNPLEI